MYTLFMTADSGSIISPISQALGFIFNAIYTFFESILNIANVNVGFVIIIFTIIIYACLLPLTYRQQKFSFMTRKMSPEIQAIQKKYRNRRDQESMLAAQEEQRAVYDKYGVSPSGSCVQMIIQLPILWALYGVFRNVPAYVGSVKNIFADLVPAVQAQPDYLIRMQDVFQKARVANVMVDFTQPGLTAEAAGNNIIDVAYKLSDNGWDIFKSCFPSISNTIEITRANLQDVNSFGLLNISDTPLNTITTAFAAGAAGLVICALLIPIVSFISQIVNMRTMNLSNNTGADQMAGQMKVMNRIMPFISLFFVFNVPIGLGLYWIAGAFFRAILQVVFNKRFEKIDLNELIEKNKEKAAAKAEKRKKKITKNANITAGANTNTRRTATDRARIEASKSGKDLPAQNRQYREGSMASKANLVSDFNKKHNKEADKNVGNKNKSSKKGKK